MRATMQSRRSALAALIAMGLAVGLTRGVGAREHAAEEFVSHFDERIAGAHYFIDFRARRGALFGHTFIVYGRVGADGQPLEAEYAGNYPADGRRGLIVGSVIPVRTIIGSVKGDLTDPATIIYRRKLTAAQFARVKAAVRHMRAQDHYWHLVFFNCNDFAVEIARSIGLSSPPSWLVPHAYITALRAMNGG